MNRFFFLLAVCWLYTACNQPPAPAPATSPTVGNDTVAVMTKDTVPPTVDSVSRQEEEPPSMVDNEKAVDKTDDLPSQKQAATLPESSTPARANFKAVTSLDPSIRLDIRYATTNNFTKAQIYDCPECLLRPEAAKALVIAHQALQAKGYGGLKMFDCYRPKPYQQRLWDKVPNPNYVTPPAKGSMHSRGAAVDLTIVDKNGKELDMGTPYDFFGRAAHYDYQQLPAAVLANRRLLRSTMMAVGFEGIRTEWWHFSYRKGTYPLSDYLWKCGEE